MKKIFYMCFCLISFNTVFAGEIKFRSENDEKIYQYGLIQTNHLAKQNPNDRKLQIMLAFLEWMREGSLEAKAIKRAIFMGKIDNEGRDVSATFVQHLQARASEIINDKSKTEQYFIYVLMAKGFGKVEEKHLLKLDLAKRSNFDLSLKTLFSNTDHPEFYDVEVEAQRLAEEEAERKAEAARGNDYDEEDEELMDKKDLTMLLKNFKIPYFAYSEISALNGINKLTHELYHWGVRFNYTGSRLAVMDVKTAKNGATYYYGPFEMPFKEAFTLSKKSVWDILEDLCQNLDLKFELVGNEVRITDLPMPEFPEYGRDGIPAYVLLEKLKNFSRSEMSKFVGKQVKFNGYVQAATESGGSKVVLTLDNSQIQLEIEYYNIEYTNFKALKTEVSKERESSKQAKRDASRQRADADRDEYERIVYGSAKMYIKGEATVKGMSGGKLILLDGQNVYMYGRGRRLTVDDEDPMGLAR